MTWPTAHIQYWAAAVLLLVGIYGMLAARNLVRKVMGMNIMQTAIIAFFLIVGAKTDATFPLVGKDTGEPAAAEYVNPLPHALMLTAIVVGVSTTGVALALLIRIQRHLGTLEEPEMVAKLHE